MTGVWASVENGPPAPPYPKALTQRRPRLNTQALPALLITRKEVWLMSHLCCLRSPREADTQFSGEALSWAIFFSSSRN